MTNLRVRSEAIRSFIVKNIEKHPDKIAIIAAQKFNITRQAISHHLQRLVDEKILSRKGKTRSCIYSLHPLEKWEKHYNISSKLEEHVVWENDVAPSLAKIPDNINDIWYYGFTEMFNNVIDHSEGTIVTLQFKKTATSIEIAIYDNGIGIFRKIQNELGLLDERHAIFELAKGKLTTDSDNHTGEGIFFTSRMFDDFDILSGATFFTHDSNDDKDWILQSKEFSGTAVWMKLNNHTSRKIQAIFSQYTDDDFGFTRTVIPVRLAQYGRDKLFSRSQAKRLLIRIDRFKTVLFDFEGVDSIGQAFADQIFRVFALKHPEIELAPINANSAVEQMISRAKGGAILSKDI